LAKSTIYVAPHYVVFSNIQSLQLPLDQIFSSAPCSQTPLVYLCSSLEVRDQVSHPYRTTGKIIVFDILIKVKVKISLLQAMEAHRVVRG
jgi:hypothetical protein